jgi:hypothetical protein
MKIYQSGSKVISGGREQTDRQTSDLISLIYFLKVGEKAKKAKAVPLHAMKVLGGEEV